MCIERVVNRTNHPGNVQGPRASGLVTRMANQLQKAGPPQPVEGIQTVMTCGSDAAVACALAAWKVYDPAVAAAAAAAGDGSQPGPSSLTGTESGRPATAGTSSMSDPWAYWLAHKPATPEAGTAVAGAQQKDMRQLFRAKQQPSALKVPPSAAQITAATAPAAAGGKRGPGQLLGASAKRAKPDAMGAAPPPADDQPPAKRAHVSEAKGADSAGHVAGSQVTQSGVGAAEAATSGNATKPGSGPEQASQPAGRAPSTATNAATVRGPTRDAFAALMRGARQQHTAAAGGGSQRQGGGIVGGQSGAGSSAGTNMGVTAASSAPVGHATGSSGAGGVSSKSGQKVGSGMQVQAATGVKGGGAGGSGEGGGSGGHDKRWVHPATQALHRMAMDPSK